MEDFWRLVTTLFFAVELIRVPVPVALPEADSFAGVKICRPLETISEIMAKYSANRDMARLLSTVIKKCLNLLMGEPLRGRRYQQQSQSLEDDGIRAKEHAIGEWGKSELLELRGLLLKPGLNGRLGHIASVVSSWINSVYPSACRGPLILPKDCPAATRLDKAIEDVLGDEGAIKRKEKLPSVGEEVLIQVGHKISNAKYGKLTGDSTALDMHIRLTLFGSAATGLASETSDVDIMADLGHDDDGVTAVVSDIMNSVDTSKDYDDHLAICFSCLSKASAEVKALINQCHVGDIEETAVVTSKKSRKKLKRLQAKGSSIILPEEKEFFDLVSFGRDHIAHMQKSLSSQKVLIGESRIKECGHWSSKRERDSFGMKSSSSQKNMMREVLKRLRRNKYRINEVVLGARVPVVKFVTTVSKPNRRTVHCDVVPYRATAVMNSALIKAYISWDTSGKLHRLLLSIKMFAKRYGLSDAPNGFLSSYAWVMLALHVMLRLRYIPQFTITHEAPFGFMLDVESVSSNEAISSAPLCVLLFRVLHFFSAEFDLAKSTATLRGFGEAVPKSSWPTFHRWRLSIEDPFERIGTSKPRDLGVTLQRKCQDKIMDTILIATKGLHEQLCLLQQPAIGSVTALVHTLLHSPPDDESEDRQSLQNHQDDHKTAMYTEPAYDSLFTEKSISPADPPGRSGSAMGLESRVGKQESQEGSSRLVLGGGGRVTLTNKKTARNRSAAPLHSARGGDVPLGGESALSSSMEMTTRNPLFSTSSSGGRPAESRDVSTAGACTASKSRKKSLNISNRNKSVDSNIGVSSSGSKEAVVVSEGSQAVANPLTDARSEAEKGSSSNARDKTPRRAKKKQRSAGQKESVGRGDTGGGDRGAKETSASTEAEVEASGKKKGRQRKQKQRSESTASVSRSRKSSEDRVQAIRSNSCGKEGTQKKKQWNKKATKKSAQAKADSP